MLEKQEYLKTCWDKYIISGEIKVLEYTSILRI